MKLSIAGLVEPCDAGTHAPFEANLPGTGWPLDHVRWEPLASQVDATRAEVGGRPNHL